jgi:hypothetical protein
MLDDIPRNRHDRITSPTGFQPVDEPLVEERPTLQMEAMLSDSDFGRTQLARPGRNTSTAGFQRAGPAKSSMGNSLSSRDPLAAALARLLVAKGILTSAELEAALEE